MTKCQKGEGKKKTKNWGSNDLAKKCSIKAEALIPN